MITTGQAIKTLIAFLIGVFIVSLQGVLGGLPFLALVVIAAVIFVLRMVGNADAVYAIGGVLAGLVAGFLIPGLQVGSDPFLVYAVALSLILKV